MSETAREAKLSRGAVLLHKLVTGYQHLSAGRPSPCRYVPSCSAYGLESLEVHGAVSGSWLTLRRFLRCHPWSKAETWDPVPPRSAATRGPLTGAGSSPSTET